MKNFHPLSFGLGLGSGLLILLLVFGGMRVFAGNNRARFGGPNGGNWQQFQGDNGGPNLARMAERFGMTEEELQKELDSGKTMQQIAQEHGVQFGGRRQQWDTGSAGTSSSADASVSSQASQNESSSQ